jgi:hypothetical protein
MGPAGLPPLVFQQKPGTQIFFFRKTSPSARKFLKLPACFSTKAWYATFLLSKDFMVGPGISQPACFSTKAWYAAFLLSKDLVIGSFGPCSYAIIQNTTQKAI